MARVLVTGASGFVGRAVVTAAQSKATISTPNRHRLRAAYSVDSAGSGDLASLMTGVDAVIHLAARVHVMGQDERHHDEYQRVNVLGTTRLARAAANAGVARFVFASTVKVHGDGTVAGPLTPESPFRPGGDYACSKTQAEIALRELERESSMAVRIVRPPLVYGPNVRANFLQLMRLVDRGIPLPFGSVDNRRSLVYVENLADLIVQCALAEGGRGETYLVADGPPVSTADLVRHIAHHLNRPVRLLDVPPAWLRFGARLLRAQGSLDRLVGSLEVDDSMTRRQLCLNPPVGFDEGMRRTCEWFRLRGREAAS